MSRPSWFRHSLAVAALAVDALVVGACLPAAPLEPSSGAAAGAGGVAETTASTPPARSGPTPIPSFVRPTPTPAPTFLVYTVRRGDSLNTIAHRYGTTARSIAFWNRSTYPSLDPETAGYRPGLLQVGWTLQVIPNVTFDEDSLAEPSDVAGSPSDATESPSDAP